MHVPTSLPTFEFNQVLHGGFRMPTRMTALPLAHGKLALVSPIPIDGAMTQGLSDLGEVAYLIAPNLLHHLYLAAASKRFPAARVLAPRGLAKKRPELRIDAFLEDGLPADLCAALETFEVAGAPGLGEHVFLHHASRTLVVTDLLFNVREPSGIAANLALFFVGCHGKLAQSRALRLMVKDRAAFARSIERIAARDFNTLVMAHGDVVRKGARGAFCDALSLKLPAVESCAAH
ncbi:MAG: hypothetical protein RL385_4568 [Pseudomonadota bacterium]|jgi:hypothetical protein